MRQIAILGILAAASFSAGAQNPVIRGEYQPGVYPNVSVDSTGAIRTSPSPFLGALVDRSGTITTGGVSQQVMATNSSRRYLLIQNTSDTTLWCNFSVAAVQNQPSFILITNASFIMENETIATSSINCIGPTTGKAFTAKEL